MEFVFTVRVELERSGGRVASRGEMAEQLEEALNEANPEELTGGAEGVYMVTNWEVEEAPRKRGS